MLYNGDRKWTAKENIFDLIDKGKIASKYIPNFSYFKIAENEFDVDKLAKIKNAVSAVFMIENSDAMKLKEKFDLLASIIKKEKPEIIELLESWFMNFLKQGYNDVNRCHHRKPKQYYYKFHYF